MRILLTNDDGVHAKGLWLLRDRLAERNSVVVVAPDRERSGVGHGITLHEPLRVTRVTVNGGGRGFAVNGTPADCVGLGFLEILDAMPDLVISGINIGENVGMDAHYSGTVAAAKEAASFGAPAIAASMEGPAVHYGEAARFLALLAEDVVREGLPRGTILNVNFPDLPMKDIAGVSVNHQTISRYSEVFEKRVDPRDRPYYWRGRGRPDDRFGPASDAGAVSSGFISITPLRCDATDHGFMETLKTWSLEVSGCWRAEFRASVSGCWLVS